MAINLNEKRAAVAAGAAGKTAATKAAGATKAAVAAGAAGKTAATKAAGKAGRKPVCSVAKKRYYRLPLHGEIGDKLKEYMQAVMDMDLQAADLAERLGMYAYESQENAEHGSIGMAYFTQPAADDDPVWENVKTIPNEKGVLPAKLYACWPKVSATQRWAIDDERLVETKKTVVSENAFTYASVVSTLKRNELAELAGVHIAPQAVVKGGKCVTPDGVEHLVDTAGMKANDVFKYIGKLMKPWRDKEDAEINARLMNKKFRAVLDFNGTDEAIEVMKQIVELPCMPSGTLISIVAGRLMDGLHLVPLAVPAGEHWYVSTDIELPKDTYEPSTKAAFDAAVKAWEESLSAEDELNEEEGSHDR